tara:strand:- start:1459 stop:1959 length:501 start_codon:yes stop_codon:yes gene_type:complete
MNIWFWPLSLLRPPLTGRHVLVFLIAFFAVIFAVNGVFLFVSLQTHPGVTSTDAYRKGLHFNRELDRADRQRARGWKSEISADRGVMEIRLTDKSARPVSGLRINAVARRPVHDRGDTELVLREIETGRYRADRPPLPPGRWEIVFTAMEEGLPPYRIEYSVQVPE